MSYIGSTTSPTTFQDIKRHRYDVAHRVGDIAYDFAGLAPAPESVLLPGTCASANACASAGAFA